MYTSIPTLAIVFTVNILSTGADPRPDTCDVAGCVNGVCVLPPVPAAPLCSCNIGFQVSLTDLNICLDIDECTLNTSICGVSFDPFLGLVVPSGRCVDTAGSFYCQCNPTVAVPSLDNKTCISTSSQQQQQQQQQSILQSLLNLILLTQIFEL